MSLQTVLDTLINERRYRKGVCQAIVINPIDFELLLKDLGVNKEDVQSHITYRDAIVYRTEDVKEGEFKVY